MQKSEYVKDDYEQSKVSLNLFTLNRKQRADNKLA